MINFCTTRAWSRSAAVSCVMLALAAHSRADDTLPAVSPSAPSEELAPASAQERPETETEQLAAANTSARASAAYHVANTKQPATRVVRRPDPRHFPNFGPLSIAGKTYYAYRFEGHVHSQYSRDARHNPLDILDAAQKLGLDALVITDHGSSAARADFPNYHGTLVPFIGREIGGEYGHAVMWNVPDDADQGAAASLESRAQFAHKHGGLLVFAHPGWWIDGNHHDPMNWMTPDAMRHGGRAGDVDAIELWNGVYRTPLPRLIDAWEKLLDAGVFVPIVGDSDFHRFSIHQLGNAHNIAFCERPEVATCLWSAVREGRIVITDGPAAVVTVNDRLPGSVLVADGSALRIDVDALAPEGGLLQLYLGKEVVQALTLQPGIRARATWQLASPAHDSYVRIDIQRPHRTLSQTPVSLLSNPVLIDVAPLQPSWR